MADIHTLTIRADTSDIRRGSQDLESFSRQTAATERSAERFRSEILKAGKVVAAFGAAGAAAFGAIAVSAGDTAFEIANLARVTGSNTDEFQRAAFAAKSYGVEQDKLSDILKDTSDKVGDFLTTGAGGMVDFFEQIAPKVGVTAEMFKDLSGKDALQLYVSSIEKANVSQNEMTFFLEAIASDATALLPLLANNGEEFERLADRADKLNAVLSESDLSALSEMDRAMSEASASSSALANSIVVELTPAITDIAKGATEFFGSFNSADIATNISALTESFKALGLVIAGGYTASLLASVPAQMAAVGAMLTANVATGVMTTSAVAATVATNALNVATKALLSPWGLLAAAVSVGAAVFVSTKKSANEATEALDTQEKSISKLVKKYERLSQGAFVKSYTDAQRELIKVDRELAEVEAKLAPLQAKSIPLESDIVKITQLKKQRDALTESAKRHNLAIEAGLRFFEQGLPKESEYKKLKENQGVVIKKTTDEQLKQAEAQLAQITSLEDLRLQLTMTADDYELYKEKMKAIANGASPEMITSIEAQVKAIQKLRHAQDDERDLASLTDEVANFGGAWTDVGSTITSAFGDITSALSDYKSQMSNVARLETALDVQRKKHGGNNASIIKAQKALEEKAFGAKFKLIKESVSATAGAFEKESSAAKAAHKVSQIIALAENAMILQKMVMGNTETAAHLANSAAKSSANATESITSAFSAPFPVGFAAGAAMIGIMSSLGVFGGGGGGSAPSLEDIQKEQGTGTLLGSSDKSSSILSAQDRFEDIAVDQLSELRGIRNSINSLSGGIEKLASSLVGSASLGEFGGDLSTSRSTGGAYGKLLAESDPTGLIGGVISSFKKVSKDVTNSGIQFVSQTLGEIIDGGVSDVKQFFDIETTVKKWWGLSKSTSTSTEFAAIDSSIGKQFANIFKHIGETAATAAETLGIDTVRTFTQRQTGLVKVYSEGTAEMVRVITKEASVSEQSVRDALNNFSFDIGKISFKDMSGEEIQKELEAVFSQQADLLSEFLVPAMSQYQKIGEGTFDTLLRVTQEQVIFNDNVDRLGLNLNKLSTESLMQVSQSVIDLVGGLDKFTEATGTFFEEFFSEEEQFEHVSKSLTEAVEGLGVSMFDSREAYKQAVQGADLANESQRKLFAGLIELAPAMDDYFDTLDDNAAKEAAKIEKEKNDAIRQANKLERDRAAFFKAAQKAEDELQRELSKARKDEQRAISDLIKEIDKLTNSAISSAKSAFSDLSSSVKSEQEKISANLAITMSDIASSFADKISSVQSLAERRTESLNNQMSLVSTNIGDLTGLSSSLASAVTSITGTSRASARADIQSAISRGRAGGSLAGLDLSNSISALANINQDSFKSQLDMQLEQAKSANELKELKSLSDNQLSSAEMNLKLLEMQIDSVKSSAERQVLALQDEQAKAESSAQTRHDEQISELDSILVTAQEQLNSTLNIESGIMSLTDAQASFTESINALSAQLAAQQEAAAIAQSRQQEINNEQAANQQKQVNSEVVSVLNSILDASIKTKDNTRTSAKIQQNWDDDGQPEQRDVS